MHAEEDSARLKELSHTLFQSGIASAHFLADETQLGADLAKYAAPDMTLSRARRRLDSFIASFPAATSTS